MRNAFFIIALMISSSPALCQQKVLLSENFKNNKNGWRLQNDSSFLAAIDNGVLHLEKFRKNFDDRGCLWYKKEIKGLNTLQDFSITLFAKFLSGGDILDMFDIQWGTWDNIIASKATSIYQLNFFLKGDVKLDYFNKGWNYSLRNKAKEMLDRNLYRPNQFNKYELIQKDGFVIFNINDKQYFKQFASPISGNTIGFQGCLKSAWAIDKIVVKQLNNKTLQLTNGLLPIAITDSILPNDNEAILKVFPNPFANEFTVLVPLKKASGIKIELFDISGNLIMQQDRKLEAGEHNLRIYADVPSGIYMLKLSTGDKISSVKLVKL